MIVALVLQGGLSILFALFGWGESYANSRGQHPAIGDMIFLFAPLGLTVLCAGLAVMARRRNQTGAAAMAALAPLPLAIVGLALSGAVEVGRTDAPAVASPTARSSSS